MLGTLKWGKVLAAKVWRKLVGIKKSKRDEVKAEAVQLVKDTYDISVSADEAEAVLIGIASLKNTL